MKPNFKILLLLTFANLVNAQKTFFLGTFRAQGTGKNYWCLNAGNYVLKEVANLNEYDNLKKEFYSTHKNEWPFTTSIKGNRPFIIFKSKTRNSSENCDVSTTGYIQADSMGKIQEILAQRKTEYKFIEEPQILYTYNAN
ncbi:hypothetical protein JI747_014100 [Chryseobacterium sp. RG1]|uniref:Uncharacterized protein n=1 Tax=Chryseobacterium tagetis TaxID=2801334 RepID=A0ABS8A3H9_9FLAO|nr:hypothetical protein [Chryseobacterium tagetis]MCA6068320.1 hypothetical protein [Chryseobacterium tagetis]